MAAAGTNSDSGAGRRGWGHWPALAVVLGLGLALRLIALRWGLPDETHLFSYHPDEYHSLRGALSVAAGDPNPHFFNYGSLYLYLAASGCVALHPGHFLRDDLWVPGGPALPEALRDWTLDARLVTVLLGMLTIWVTYAIGRRIWGHRAGLVAALALAVMPLHVVHSHYATVDVPMTFFVALTLLLSLRVVEAPTWRNLAWAGLSAGLAASVKYSGIVCLVAPATAWIIALARGRRGETARPPAVAPAILLIAPIIAFAVTSPYTFLDWQNAWRDISFEMQHVRVGDDPAAIARDPCGWWFHAKQLHLAAGWPLVFVAILGAIGGLRRGRWEVLPLVAFGVVVFAAMGAGQVRYARYEMPLLPALAVMVGWAGRRGRFVMDRAMEGLLVVIGLLWTVALSAVWLQVMQSQDPRPVALAVLERALPEDGTLGLVSEPWFHHPPVDYCNGGRALRSNPLWRSYKRPVRKLVVTGLDPAALREPLPDAFLFTDFDLAAPRGQVEAFMAELRRHYRVSSWTSDDGTGVYWPQMLRPAPAHDWLYPFPLIHWCPRRSDGERADGGAADE